MKQVSEICSPCLNCVFHLSVSLSVCYGPSLTASVAHLAAVTELPPFSLRWTCTSGNFNMSAGSSALLTALSSRSLVIAENSLAPGQLYAFTLLLTNLENAAQSASASVSFRTAGVPNAGACTASPSAGVALVDKIALVCQNWQDDAANYPLAYQFQSAPQSDLLASSLSSNPTSLLTLQDFSASSSMSAFLSAGAWVRVTVRNRWGGVSAPFVIALNMTNPVIQARWSDGGHFNSIKHGRVSLIVIIHFHRAQHMCSGRVSGNMCTMFQGCLFSTLFLTLVIQNASALTSVANVALDAMARAAGSGDVNAAAQVCSSQVRDAGR
jgi:hypothetical protein